jgi:phosphonate transport system ATP-binding protein
VTVPGAAALEVTGVSFAYRAGRPVLRAVDLDARAGEVTMILGVSGSGKTTLLKLCKGLLAPQHGNVRVLGEPVDAAVGRGRLDARVAYIPQQLGLARTLSVMENVLTGALARLPILPSLVGAAPDAERRRATDLLDRMGIAGKAQEKVFALSGGERQRVAIARALMQQPEVLLADEFISDLDPVTSETIMRIVAGIAGEGVAVIMTTHEMEVVRAHAGHVVVLRAGEKVLDVRTQPELDQIVAAFR